MAKEREKVTENENPDMIIGRNAVSEALSSGRPIDSLLVTRGAKNGSLGRIVSQCRERGIVVKEVDGKKLDAMCSGGNHQGVIMFAAAHEYSGIDDMFELARSRGEEPFIVILDELEDPRNLGAIVRTAEAAGAHGVIIPKRRSASLSFSVAKTAAGALEYVPVAKVANLPGTIDELKKKGLWIYGADMNGTCWCQQDYNGPIGLVIGSEGNGIGRLVREKCDFIVSLPMKGHINSLNASVAAGILMYEISRQRSGIKGK
ncbi:MAG: 23S rRNA (guanosine(2251)-2'-O)-methyltransferase RlmB [Acutalibacteraceae bacterium]|nr:23S rRNA (guanosine(2251)-2'-O)-methyltransferase RlmB [Oscillospiraceae bacterium]